MITLSKRKRLGMLLKLLSVWLNKLRGVVILGIALYAVRIFQRRYQRIEDAEVDKMLEEEKACILLEGEDDDEDFCDDETDGNSAHVGAEDNFFAYTNLIGCLDEEECADLYHHFKFRTAKRHEILFKEGEPCDSMIIVVQGRVGLYQHVAEWENDDELLPSRTQTDETEATAGAAATAVETCTGRSPQLLVQVLPPTESVGDLDIIDGGPRMNSAVVLLSR